MTLQPQENLPLLSLSAFQRLLGNSGNLTEHHDGDSGEVLNAAVELYRAAISDPVTQPAAFGMAVAVISTNLEVSLRAGALILATLIDINTGAPRQQK